MLFYRNCLKNSEDFFVNKDLKKREKNFFILKGHISSQKNLTIKISINKD